MSDAATISGSVKAINHAPRGEIDALMVETAAGLVQVNVPPAMGEQVQALLGQDVTVRTSPEPKLQDRPRGDHPVHRCHAFADTDQGGTTPAPAGSRPAPPHAKPIGPVEVAGTVARLNYARHGEANGVVLETGDFLHLKPDGMKRLDLQPGQSVTAKGEGSATMLGTKVVEAKEVNGTKIGPKKAHSAFAADQGDATEASPSALRNESMEA